MSEPDKKFETGHAFRSLDEALKAIQNPLVHSIQIEEGQRQLVILALALLSLDRPGWFWACEEIALLMDNKDQAGRAEMFEEFRRNRTGSGQGNETHY